MPPRDGAPDHRLREKIVSSPFACCREQADRTAALAACFLNEREQTGLFAP